MTKTTVLSQILQLISSPHFKRIVKQHDGDRYAKHFTCKNQLLTMLISQAKGLMSLRDIVTCCQSRINQWYHWGVRNVARSTLADANNRRPAAIFEDLFYQILAQCKALAPAHRFRFKNPLYALDATTISLCLSVFPWARFRTRKGGLKIHTLLDHRGTIPSFVSISEAGRHELKIAKDSMPLVDALEPDSIVAMDRGYIDFKWLYSLHKRRVFFVVRMKGNLTCDVTGQLSIPERSMVQSDDCVMMRNPLQKAGYPEQLRRITYRHPESGERIVLITNNFKLASRTIADIYKSRWQVELFFKWIKQNLKIKTFLGTSKNAVMIQIWIAMIYYLLLSFIKFQGKYGHSLLKLTRIIREKLFDYVSIFEFLRMTPEKYLNRNRQHSQLALFPT